MQSLLLLSLLGFAATLVDGQDKPGTCPPLDKHIQNPCGEEPVSCSTDSDCDDELKCCLAGEVGPICKMPHVPCEKTSGTVTCSSRQYKRASCELPGEITNVHVYHKYSRSACRWTHSFGSSNNAVWVDKGCRAKFDVEYEQCNECLTPTVVTMDCSSWQYKFTNCTVEGRVANLVLHNKKSNSPCDYMKSYGFDTNRLWVDDGCRADFKVTIADPGC